VGMTIPQAQNVLSEAAKSVERAVAVGSAVDSEIEGAQTNLPKAEQAFEEAIRSIGSVLGAGIELTGLKQAAGRLQTLATAEKEFVAQLAAVRERQRQIVAQGVAVVRELERIRG
jgi:hypothetical protein